VLFTATVHYNIAYRPTRAAGEGRAVRGGAAERVSIPLAGPAGYYTDLWAQGLALSPAASAADRDRAHAAAQTPRCCVLERAGRPRPRRPAAAEAAVLETAQGADEERVHDDLDHAPLAAARVITRRPWGHPWPGRKLRATARSGELPPLEALLDEDARA